MVPLHRFTIAEALFFQGTEYCNRGVLYSQYWSTILRKEIRTLCNKWETHGMVMLLYFLAGAYMPKWLFQVREWIQGVHLTDEAAVQSRSQDFHWSWLERGRNLQLSCTEKRLKASVIVKKDKLIQEIGIQQPLETPSKMPLIFFSKVSLNQTKAD